MDEEESLSERQDNELQALTAIFSDQNSIIDQRTKESPWVHNPPDVRIHLLPVTSIYKDKVHVSVFLRIKRNNSYPHTIPDIKLENSKGLSNEQLEELLKILILQAKHLIGEVMILPLTMTVQSWLAERNVEPTSFYDQMLLNRQIKQATIEDRTAKDQRIKFLREEAKKIKDLENILNKRDEEIRENDNRKKRIDQEKSISDVDLNMARLVMKKSDRRRHESILSDEFDVCEEHSFTKTIEFYGKQRDYHIFRGRCLGHREVYSSSSKCITYSAMCKDSGRILAITEWNYTSKDNDSIENCLKQVRASKQEFFSLIKLKNNNLIQYHAINHSQNKDQVTIQILTGYIGGGTLARYINNDTFKNAFLLSPDLIRHYMFQLLKAISFIHCKSFVHRDLRASSCFINYKGELKLADFSYMRRISDIVSNPNRSTLKYTKRKDLEMFARILLSLTLGYNVCNDILTQAEIKKCPLNVHSIYLLCFDEHINADTLLKHEYFDNQSSMPQILNKKEIRVNKDDDFEKCNEFTENIPEFIPTNSTGSRLQNEFEIISFIGKGAFGDVIKVRNKLDTRLYAIKRIPLKSENNLLKRKITREVKLLSQLNHINVVRYINSWIETTVAHVQKSSKNPSISEEIDAPNSLVGFEADFLSSIKPHCEMNSSWSTSDLSSSSPPQISDIGDAFGKVSSAANMEDVFGKQFKTPYQDSQSSESSNDGIDFLASESLNLDLNKKLDEFNPEIKEEDKEESGIKIQFLYIQMEFCKGNTIRSCIDAGLYKDTSRVWRLFREICEGINHVHSQGIIHRDLKPLNIFLDELDQIKIGDLGLATAPSVNKKCLTSELSGISIQFSSGDGMMTGKVGTLLYVSPEMLSGSKAQYDQKVDMYSLGVILFEMCTKPLTTGMERVEVLTALRSPNITLPSYIDLQEIDNQIELVKWLLQHDPSLRPSSFELLNSPLLPITPLPESELNDLLRSTISNPDSRAYKHMVANMLNQAPNISKDYIYEDELYKSADSIDSAYSEHVLERVVSVFKKHGAICLTNSALLTPKQRKNVIVNKVNAMTSDGTLVYLPYDLQMNTARYIARTNIKSCKLYCLANKVFREHEVSSSHPKQLRVCSFDVVTCNSANVTNELLSDAEVISIIGEIIEEFPSVSNKMYFLRLNHSSLLQSLLLFCGIDNDLHEDVCSILSDNKMEKPYQIKARLQRISISCKSVEMLFRYIEAESSYQNTFSSLKQICRTYSKARLAFTDLHHVISHLSNLKFKWSIVIAPGFVNNYTQYSGVFYQLISSVKHKSRYSNEIFSAGGRYDKMIEHFKRPPLSTHLRVSTDVRQQACGMSISFDRLVSIIKNDKTESSFPYCAVDVMICSLGRTPANSRKLKLAKQLWNIGISLDFEHDISKGIEEVQLECKEKGISFILMIKDDISTDVKLRFLEKDRFVEKRFNVSEIIEFLQQKLITKNNSNIQVSFDKTIHQDKKNSLWNIIFISNAHQKLSKNARRSHEQQIFSSISPSLSKINNSTFVEILALDLEINIIKTISSLIEINGDIDEFEISSRLVMEEHQRHRKYLLKILNFISDDKFEKRVSVFVLYSLIDSNFRIII